MKKNEFRNPKTIVTSMLSMLVGVAIYCGVIAPLIKDGSYAETAGATFRGTGLGMGATVIVIGAVWLIVVAVMNRTQK